MSVESPEQWIGLLAAEEDRARIQKHLEDLDFKVWSLHPGEGPPRAPRRSGPDVLIVSIPRQPQAVGAEPLPVGSRRIQASVYFQDTWHGVICEMREQAAAILAAVPARYPALDAVFASGATEVLEGEITLDALNARLRALHARLKAGLADNMTEGRGAMRIPGSAATANVDAGNGVLGSYAGTVHDPESGRIDAKRVASFLGIPLRRLTGALELSYVSVHKTPDAPSIQAPLRPLAQIVELLNELSSGPRDIKVWLNRPLPELEGDSPLATILAGEAEAVETLLWNVREGIPA